MVKNAISFCQIASYPINYICLYWRKANNLNCIFPWHSMTLSTLASNSWPCFPSAAPLGTTEVAAAKAISDRADSWALAHPAGSLFNLVMKSQLDYLTKNRPSESSRIVSHSNTFWFGKVPWSPWKTGVWREIGLLVAKKQRNDLSSPPHFWIFRKTGNPCYSVLHTSPCTSHHAFLSLASAPLPFMTISLVPFELCKYHPSHPLLLFTSLLALLLFLGSLQYLQDTGFTSAMGQQCWAVVYTDNDPQAFTIIWLQPKYIK